MTRAALALALLAACSRPGGRESCEDAVRNVDRVTGDDGAAFAREVEQCRRRAPSPETLACVARARSLAGIDACGEPLFGRMARTTDATATVRKIYEGARAYYEDQ